MSSLMAALIMNDGACIFLAPVIANICDDLEFVSFANYSLTSNYAASLSDLLQSLWPRGFQLDYYDDKFSANIGSSATVTGNPKNMLILDILSSSAPISFIQFSLKMIPAAMVGTLMNMVLLCWFYRKELNCTQQRLLDVGSATALAYDRQLNSVAASEVLPLDLLRSAKELDDEDTMQEHNVQSEQYPDSDDDDSENKKDEYTVASPVESDSGGASASSLSITINSNNIQHPPPQHSLAKITPSTVILLALMAIMYALFIYGFPLGWVCLGTAVIALICFDAPFESSPFNDSSPSNDSLLEGPRSLEEREKLWVQRTLDNQHRVITKSINWSLIVYLFSIFIVVEGIRTTHLWDGVWFILGPLLKNPRSNANLYLSSVNHSLDILNSPNANMSVIPLNYGVTALLLPRLLGFTFLTAILSLAVTSIPTVLLLQPSIDDLAQSDIDAIGEPPNGDDKQFKDRRRRWIHGWYMILAWSVTMAGNLTAFGSVAGVLVTEICGRRSIHSDTRSPLHSFWGWFRFASWSTVLIASVGVSVIFITSWLL